MPPFYGSDKHLRRSDRAHGYATLHLSNRRSSPLLPAAVALTRALAGATTIILTISVKNKILRCEMRGGSLYLARSRAEATDLFRVTHARTDKLRKLASIREMIGLDLTDWPDGRRIMPADLPEPPTRVRSRTHADLLRRLVLRTAPTSTELMARPEVVGSAHWQVIGTVDDAMEQIADWAAAGAMDGFIALPGGSVDSMRLTLDDLVPRLSQVGLFEYSGSRLGDHLREAG